MLFYFDMNIVAMNYIATINGHSYSTFIGPVPSNGSPGLPLTLDNSTPTPNPPITTTSSNATDVEDGSTTTSTLNKYDQGPSKYDQSQSGPQSQNQHDHHHHDIDNRSFPTESPNDSLIILQPSGTSSENSATGLGAYSPMLPSYHYAPGKYFL